ncbi:hypothetical protein LIER_13725 [Lithospermum erythrorhizon]|uniref:MULE transposase domain-containing protein n=1 Tax=Lithospermum erythrorhizon TaxID=34254 RepID=A0AAV3PWG4_LITER
MKIPPGFEKGKDGQVWRLRKYLYLLKQAPRCWSAKFAEALRPTYLVLVLTEAERGALGCSVESGNDDDRFRSEHDSSGDDDHSKLDRFPKYNSKIDERNPRKLGGEAGLQIRGCHLDHTCIPVYDNETLKSSWLAKHYVKKFRNSPTLKAYDFRKEINLKLGHHVSKWQARRAKTSGIRTIYGDETEQFKRIYDFCTEMVESNPGTKCNVKTIDNVDGKPEFQRWGGKLLVAVGNDPNNNIFPIAYGIVEVENKNSWEWFLSHLYEDLRDNGENDDG